MQLPDFRAYAERTEIRIASFLHSIPETLMSVREMAASLRSRNDDEPLLVLFKSKLRLALFSIAPVIATLGLAVWSERLFSFFGALSGGTAAAADRQETIGIALMLLFLGALGYAGWNWWKLAKFVRDNRG